MAAKRSALILMTALTLAVGCASSTNGKSKGPPGQDETKSAPKDLLAIDGAQLLHDDPHCARKVAKSPFAYFRYANRSFVDLVCTRYEKSIGAMPLVHAHGDAHLEQYAVAAEGRGLADFDASAVGPPIVDLARFATSIVLASPNDEPAARAAIAAFVRGYRHALEDPSATIEEPAAARRLRARFAPTKLEWLDRVQTYITPTPPKDQHLYDMAWADFIAQVRERDPSVEPAFFKIKVGGHLSMGIGSVHAEKFLVRIEGPTPAPDDDLIMEAKALETGALGRCMRGADLDAMRVITGQAQISNAPQRFLAAVTIKGKPYYSHTWLVHYTELATTDITSSKELAELSEDVGLQLGRGHAKQADTSRVPEQRRALLKAIDAVGPTLADEAVDLAKDVTQAWVKYRPRVDI